MLASNAVEEIKKLNIKIIQLEGNIFWLAQEIEKLKAVKEGGNAK